MASEFVKRNKLIESLESRLLILGNELQRVAVKRTYAVKMMTT